MTIPLTTLASSPSCGVPGRLPPLVDSFARPITYLRVSVTDRCNLRCVYCMPEDGVPWIPKEDVLSYEELLRVIHLATRMGVTKIRITGGEPLLRRDLPDFIGEVSRLPGVRDLGLTTNGMLLAEKADALKAAGLHRINVSVDTLDPHRFRALTRWGSLETVLDGLKAADAAGLHPIKVNTVLMESTTRDDILGFIELARNHPYEVRFIEYMPFGQTEAVTSTSADQVLALLNEVDRPQPLDGSGCTNVARRFALRDGKGTIGVITPLSEKFCDGCNRIRLTPTGHIKTCLLTDGSESDLRAVLRDGATDAELEQYLRDVVWTKPFDHAQSFTQFRKCALPMSQVGG